MGTNRTIVAAGAAPSPRVAGRRYPTAQALTGILFVLRTGCPWEYLPQELGCGSGMTCWRRLRDWQAAGVWEKIWRVLLDELGLADEIDWSKVAIDSCSVRALFGGRKPAPIPRIAAKMARSGMLSAMARGRRWRSRTPARTSTIRKQAIPLIDAIPPIKRPGGGRRKRPDAAFADRAYDAEDKIRVPLRERGIQPFIAKRNTEHGSGLGIHRCVVEGVFSWLFKFRRLRVRYEKRDDIHTAFLTIGCLLICWNRMEGFC